MATAEICPPGAARPSTQAPTIAPWGELTGAWHPDHAPGWLQAGWPAGPEVPLRLTGPVYTEPASDGLVVAGPLILDNADALRAHTGQPEASPHALLAAQWRQCLLQVGLTGPGRVTPPDQLTRFTRAARLLADSVDGLYAVAIYDRRLRCLVLLRDAVGGRTLYFARTGGGLAFASRPRALLAAPGVDTSLDHAALRDYLIYAFVPGEQTMRRGIRELRPGGILLATPERVHPPQVAWSPTEPPEALTVDGPADLETWARHTRTVVADAVTRRMPEGQPLGVYLSGGLDSSLVTALAAQTARERGQRLLTWSVHFGGRFPDERTWADLVARHCGTEHHEIEVPAQAMTDSLFETMAALDDPIGDPLTLPNLYLGRRAAEEVGVILNGEGGDPLFGGPKNQPMLLHALYQPDDDPAAAYLASYQKGYRDLPTLLTPMARAALRASAPPEDRIRPMLDPRRMQALLNRLMLINTRLKGADHILTKVSNLTTAAGVLGRSPLFDRRLVTLAFATPPTLKLASTIEKAVLKAAVRDLLPSSVIARPKSGMRVPVQGWLRTTLKRYAKRLLLDKQARIRPWIDQAVLKSWLTYRGDPWSRYGRKIWLMLSLEAWLRVQFARGCSR